MPLRKKPILSGEVFNPVIHIDRRAGKRRSELERRQSQREKEPGFVYTFHGKKIPALFYKGTNRIAVREYRSTQRRALKDRRKTNT